MVSTRTLEIETHFLETSIKVDIDGEEVIEGDNDFVKRQNIDLDFNDNEFEIDSW